MGKSKKGKGKKGKGKSKGSKGKKKVEVIEEPRPPPDLNMFVYVRRKNVTLSLETHEEATIHDMKLQVATILHQLPEDITLFSMTGKKEELMEEKEKPPKEDEKKKDDKKKNDKKDAKGSKQKGSKGKNKSKERDTSPLPKPPEDMTLGKYGYNPKTSSIFKPAVIGLSYRGEDGQFEKLDITPYGDFPVIPEAIKMHLRNYVPPPPPPPKKSGNSNTKK